MVCFEKKLTTGYFIYRRKIMKNLEELVSIKSFDTKQNKYVNINEYKEFSKTFMQVLNFCDKEI